MARIAKNQKLKQEMCDRLITVMDLLDKNENRLSEALGYANSTTLTKVRNGESFVDVEKLHKLASIEIDERVVTNLHWIINGVGLPFISPFESSNNDLADHWSKVVLNKIAFKSKKIKKY